MAQDIFEELVNKAAAAGMTDVRDDARLSALLRAAAAGLELYRDELDRLYRELYAVTAEDDGLEEYEWLLSAVNTDSSLEGRRSGIIAALSLSDKNGAEKMLSRTGDIYNISGTLSKVNGVVVYSTAASLTSDQAQRIEEHIGRLMPPYVQFRLALQ